jgi:hypothetical protein
VSVHQEIICVAIPTTACATSAGSSGAKSPRAIPSRTVLLDVGDEERLRAPDEVVVRGRVAEDDLEDLAVLLREAEERGVRGEHLVARVGRMGACRVDGRLERTTVSSTTASKSVSLSGKWR